MKNIIDIPLTDSFFITLLHGRLNSDFSLSRSLSGTICFHNGKYVASEFGYVSYRNHKMIGRVSDITEEKAIKIFDAAGILAPYINYHNRDVNTHTALDSLYSFIQSHEWVSPIEETWMIIPNATKKLVGKKILMDFKVCNQDFTMGHAPDLECEVFMTPITKKSQSVNFSMFIPGYIYNQCMTDPDVDSRPVKNYIESERLSELHNIISSLCSQAINIKEMENDAKKAKKIIGINFLSGEKLNRDGYNHAYTGQEIKTSFNFYIAYQLPKTTFSSAPSGMTTFSYKKYQSGMGSTEKGVKGIIDTELKGKKHYISELPKVIIDWTQEREDFLTRIEEQFRTLSLNLNSFLKDLDNEKIEALIANNKSLMLPENTTPKID